MTDLSPRRIDALDILRGLVVMGIFLININYFSTPAIERYHPTVHGDFTGLNRWIWILSLTFVKQRLMMIFSVLFGAGLYLMSRSGTARAKGPARTHFARMGWLMVFGLLHAYLIWDGDILVTYAVCGAGVFFLRNLPARVLWVLSILLILGPLAPDLPRLFAPREFSADARAWWNPDAEALQTVLQANGGTWWAETRPRILNAFSRQTGGLWTFTLWRVSGLMLLGVLLIRNGFLAARRSRAVYVKTLLATGVPGAALSIWGTWYYLGSDFDYFVFGRELTLAFQLGSLTLGAAYMAAMMLLVQADGFVRLKLGLAALGRMAFTNYILQSVIGTLIFFGYGLGLFGLLSRTFLVAICLTVWAVQMGLSVWWLNRFRFGPLEWVWRSLTYRERQPWRL